MAGGESVQEKVREINDPKRKLTVWHEVHMEKNPDADTGAVSDFVHLNY